jgi:hypothetical protein
MSATKIYPEHPGAQGEETSFAAAEAVAPDAATLRQDCLRILKLGPATADEVAESLGRSVLSIRPRITELKTMGRIRSTKERRPNRSGKSAVVVEALPEDQRPVTFTQQDLL